MVVNADFHIHSGEDPLDRLPHTVFEVIDRAAARGVRCIAITDHWHYTFNDDYAAHAAARGVLLVPAIEARILDRDLIILNADAGAERLRTFDDLRAYRASRDIFTIAPHPFYPINASIRELAAPHIDQINAIEISSCYLSWHDRYNKQAAAFARAHGKPLIASTDAHGLWQVGNVWTELVCDELSLPAVIAALRAGRATPVHRPMTHWELFKFFVIGDAPRKAKNAWRRLRGTLYVEPDVAVRIAAKRELRHCVPD